MILTTFSATYWKMYLDGDVTFMQDSAPCSDSDQKSIFDHDRLIIL